ncbi:hypothetical protein B9Z55_022876 [Caenorhabditis nigoni]|nr:hypothetical protein B9Z55_022876 [Caenorhabditis nigoni]
MDDMRELVASDDLLRECTCCSKDFYSWMSPAIAPAHQFGNSSRRPFAGIGSQRSAHLNVIDTERWLHKSVYITIKRSSITRNAALFAMVLSNSSKKVNNLFANAVSNSVFRFSSRIVSWCTLRMDAQGSPFDAHKCDRHIRLIHVCGPKRKIPKFVTSKTGCDVPGGKDANPESHHDLHGINCVETCNNC